MHSRDDLTREGSGDPQAFDPILLSITDTCRVLGIGRTFTYRLIGEGKLVARKIGGRTAVEMESIRSFAAGLPRIGEQFEDGGIQGRLPRA